MCQATPIVGIKYTCDTCDAKLCQNCFRSGLCHSGWSVLTEPAVVDPQEVPLDLNTVRWTVNAVRRCRTVGYVKEYEIRWHGDWVDSWETAKGLDNPAMLEAYHARYTLSGAPRVRHPKRVAASNEAEARAKAKKRRLRRYP